MWNNKAPLAVIALLSGLASGVYATESQVQVHGFISQALVHTTANDVGGQGGDELGWDLREMGVNLSYRPNADWLLAGQALARWAGETDEGQPRIDYAIVDRTLYASEDSRVGLQVGKVKNPYGLYNMTRDVAQTRPGIIMPQSIYLDRIRNFFLASPGIAAYGSHNHGDWDISWRLNAMRPDADSEDWENLLFLTSQAGSYEGENSWLGQVMTEMAGGRMRLGLSGGRVVSAYKPGPADPIGRGRSILRPLLLSVEWNEERWSLAGEYERVRNNGEGYGLGGNGPEDPNTVEAWYIQGTWRVTPSRSVYLRRDAFYFDRDDKSGKAFAALNGVQASVMYSKDWVLGARQDWKRWSFSAEVHQVEGTAWLSPLDTPIANQQKSWRMLLLQAAYQF